MSRGEGHGNGGSSARIRAERAFTDYLERKRQHPEIETDQVLLDLETPVRQEFLEILRDYDLLRDHLATQRANLAPGLVLGDYQLQEMVGRGAMGSVWRARQVSLGRLVALKILHLHLSLSERGIERFRREAEAAARVSHPGIVTVHAVGEADGLQFIAQELVSGGHSLADELASLRESSELPSDHYRRVATMFAEIAEALQAAHEGGVVHRDLKPGNILLTDRGTPRIADFGLAKLADAPSLSRTGELSGTPFYLSPEQAESRRGEVGPRSDVFALGATLYEALTLRRPFEGDTTHQVIGNILSADPPDPRSLRSRVPRDLAVICGKALEKRPAKRYGSMRALAEDLRRWLAHEPIVARPPGSIERAVKWARRHPVVSTASALIVSALLVIGALYLDTRRLRSEAVASRAREIHVLMDQYRSAERVEERERREKEIADEWGDMETWLSQAIATTERVLGGDREPTLLLCRDYAFLLHELGRNDEALEQARLALDGFRSLHGEDHPETLESLETYATALYGSRKHPEAEAAFCEIVETARRSQGEVDRIIARAVRGIARAQLEQGHYDEALASYGDALRRLQEIPGASDSIILATRLEQAILEIRRGNPGGAESELSKLLEDCLSDLGERHPSTLFTRLALAQCLAEQDRLEEAEVEVEGLLDQVDKPGNPNRKFLVRFKWELAETLRLQGQLEEAGGVLEDILETVEVQHGPHSDKALGWKLELASNLSERGLLERARDLVREIEADEAGLGKEVGRIQWHRLLLQAEDAERRGQTVRAKALAEGAVTAAAKYWGQTNERVGIALMAKARILAAHGSLAEARTAILLSQKTVDPSPRRRREKASFLEEIGGR